MATDDMTKAALAFIGARLRSHRLALGFDMGLADTAAGITKSTVSKIERGMTDMRLSTFMDLCEAWGLSAVEVLHGAMEARDYVREGSTSIQSEAVVKWDYIAEDGSEAQQEVAGELPDDLLAVLVSVEGEDDAREGYREDGIWRWSDSAAEIQGKVYAWAHLPAAAGVPNGPFADWLRAQPRELARPVVALIAEHAVSREEAA